MPIDVLTRWLHVWFAAIVIGGAVFQWLAVLPAMSLLSDEQRMLMRERVNARWGKVIALSVLLLLLTGFYNYLFTGQPRDKQYHMLMGIKIVLALPVFFLASALAGRSPKFAGLRRAGGLWLLVILLLMTGIVGIGSYLKVTRAGGAAPAPVVQTPPSE
ncbi:MAG: hypothetical protein KF774_13995 [Planctomyces sp.]|nr:hypothetical protein [Planctomyces sp.]